MHYTAYPIPKHLVDKVGDQWVKIGNIVTDGPYKPVEWVPGSHVLTAKNDQWYDVKDLDIDGVRFLSMEDVSAGFRRYQAGEIDWMTDYPKDQFKFIQANLPGQGHFAPFAGLYYYVFNTTKPPFDNAKVRQALSMAVYREVIGPKVLGSGEPAAFGWVPPGMNNYPKEGARFDWKDEAYPQRVEEAKKLLAEAGYGPDKPLNITLSYNTSDNHKRIAVAIAAMWKPLGINVSLVNAEVKVHYANLREGAFEVARAGWLADFNDPVNFLDLLKTGIEMNYGRWSNEKYDALLDQASTQQDLEKRAETAGERREDRARRRCRAADLLLPVGEHRVPEDQGLRGQRLRQAPHALDVDDRVGHPPRPAGDAFAGRPSACAGRRMHCAPGPNNEPRAKIETILTC